MYLSLERCRHNKYGTFGELLLCDGSSSVHLAYTLEPSLESRDLFGSLPIEDGVYKLSVTMSSRFHKLLPYVHHHSRLGIRIHEGNTVSDTSGCILVGLFDDKTKITFSKFALNCVLNAIKQFSINSIKITSLYGQVSAF